MAIFVNLQHVTPNKTNSSGLENSVSSMRFALTSFQKQLQLSTSTLEIWKFNSRNLEIKKSHELLVATSTKGAYLLTLHQEAGGASATSGGSDKSPTASGLLSPAATSVTTNNVQRSRV